MDEGGRPWDQAPANVLPVAIEQVGDEPGAGAEGNEELFNGYRISVLQEK